MNFQKKKQKKQKKKNSGRIPFFAIGPFCTPPSICLNIGF